MDYFDNVRIPVFGLNAKPVSFTAPATAQVDGNYFSDDDWLSPDNATRIQGVVEGIARSTDYNTVMRQCSVMSSVLANILAYRNSLTRSNGIPFGNSKNAPIGTVDNDIEGHIGALSEIFSDSYFLSDNEVTTRTIADLAVTTAKLAVQSVTNDKIGIGAVSKSKLGSDLVSTGQATANGITVKLSQAPTAGEHGLIIGVESTKVNNAAHTDSADNASKVQVNNLPSTNPNIYLCGTQLSTETYCDLYSDSNVYISEGSQVNALSFNVVSDRRLKENIRDVGEHQVKALVENTDVKLYNYRKTPKDTTIGLIAQDVKASNSPLSDLLVFNITDSTGKKTDMYGLHEDKLVYVLWNFVQQQAKRISELEKKVEDLTK